MEFTLCQIYKDMIKNGDISYTLENGKEGMITEMLITETGPKKILKR